MKEGLRKAWDAAVKQCALVQQKGWLYEPLTFDMWYEKYLKALSPEVQEPILESIEVLKVDKDKKRIFIQANVDFSLKGKTYILRRAKDGQGDFSIAKGGLDNYLYSKIYGRKYMSPFPDGNYRIIGLVKDLTEEQCAEIVEDNGMGCWDNYKGKEDERYTCLSAKESFLSLINTPSMMDNNWLLIEKLKT